MVRNSMVLADCVSQTLFIPLWARAAENHRRDGILKDSAAERIVSMLPESTFAFPKKAPMMIGSVVRARHFDDMARHALAQGGFPVLVHLGCGLDDRFGRTDTGVGTQVNIDLPDVMALRSSLMPAASERNLDWNGSLLDTDWMDRLLATWPHGTFTFFMEGPLMYFTEEDVRSLFVSLAKRFPGATLHFDACDSRMCQLVGNQEAIRQAKAPFKWGMDNEKVLENWHPALEHQTTSYYFEMFRRRWGWLSLMRFVPRYGRGMRMLQYRIAAAD